MAYRLLNKDELDEFKERNSELAKSLASAIADGSTDFCPYIDIVAAWKRDYRNAILDIVPVVGEGDVYGESATNVVYEVRTKDGTARIDFCNRSTESCVQYASRRLGQAFAFIMKEAIKRDYK